jgi:hypothetical protein
MKLVEDTNLGNTNDTNLGESYELEEPRLALANPLCLVRSTARKSSPIQSTISKLKYGNGNMLPFSLATN